MLRTSLAIGLAAVLTTGGAFAQEETTVQSKTTTTTTTTSGQRFSVLLKSKVLIQDDQPAGQIVDVVFNEGGCVDYLVASYEDQYYVVPYSATQVRYADQVVFVDIAPAQFRKVQFFRGNNWPNFYANDYRTNIFATFNVNSFRNDGGNRATFKRGVDDDADRNPRRNRDDADTPRRNNNDQPTPRNQSSGDRPDGEKSVNPKDTPRTEKPTNAPKAEAPAPEKKPIGTPKDDTPTKETKKPIDTPREPQLKNPPKPLPKPTEPKLPQ